MKKAILHLLLMTLLLSTNGCLTYDAVSHARGTLKGNFIISDKVTDKKEIKPKPAYYGLLPLTVPADVAFSPFELIFWLSAENESFGT